MPPIILTTHESARWLQEVPRNVSARESHKMPDVKRAQREIQAACQLWDYKDHPMRNSHGLPNAWEGGTRRILQSELRRWNFGRLERLGANPGQRREAVNARR